MTSQSTSQIAGTNSKQPDSKHIEMMKQGLGIPVLIKSTSEKTSPGEVRLQIWDQRARMKRALKFLGIFWGLSLATVLIPLAHFVLVPSLFLAGPIVAWVIYQQERAILGGQGKCPECGAFFPIARTADQWPLSDLCTNCYTNMKIEKT